MCCLGRLYPLPLRRVGNWNNKNWGSSIPSALFVGGFVKDYSTEQGGARLVDVAVPGLAQAAAGVI